MDWDQPVLLVVGDSALKQELLRELALHRPPERGDRARGHYQVSMAANPAEALRRLCNGAMPPRGGATAVVVLDEAALAGSSGGQTGTPQLFDLAERVPVILLLDPERPGRGPVRLANGVASLIAAGRLEVVPRSAGFLPLVMALLERRAARAERREPDEESWQSFGEILRHELNNPLTGILGNAELLLARRDRLPPADVERLKTIADMAVRLRETVRRLSNAWEGCAVGAAEVETNS